MRVYSHCAMPTDPPSHPGTKLPQCRHQAPVSHKGATGPGDPGKARLRFISQGHPYALHTCTYPTTHGARCPVPPTHSQPPPTHPRQTQLRMTPSHHSTYKALASPGPCYLWTLQADNAPVPCAATDLRNHVPSPGAIQPPGHPAAAPVTLVTQAHPHKSLATPAYMNPVLPQPLPIMWPPRPPKGPPLGQLKSQ